GRKNCMSAEWQVGDRIQKRWEIHNILLGGMGIVYVVYDHELRLPYAVKTFQDTVFARRLISADRFMQEALAWINLDRHQNVTAAEFVHTIGGKPFLFLEFVSGGDLGNWISTPRLTKDLPQVLRFAIQFCDGMAHALSKGVKAHRDIKPQNCLITQDQTLKVTDFGLAKVFDEAVAADSEISDPKGSSVGLSRTGAAAGTCSHMAPEQFDDFKRVDVRADIYSFGVMLYQMVSGRLPFLGDSLQEFERLHKSQRIPALDQQPLELSRLVQRCLAKDPAGRYSDFGEVRNRLAEIYKGLTGAEAPQPASGAELNALQLFNKGLSLSALGHNEEALGYYDHLLESHPRLSPVWSNKAGVLQKLGRHMEALECCGRALELDPRFAVEWINSGFSMQTLGKKEDALEHYERAIAINPHLEQAWHNKGNLLYASGHRREALDCFDHALEINPHDGEIWMNKGIVLHESGQLEEAVVCFDRALEINDR